MSDITYGRSKPNSDLTLADVRRHAIWIWAVDEETVPGQDETWVKPVTSHTDVTEDLIAYVPRVVLIVQGTEYLALGDFFAAGDIVGNHILQSVHPDAQPSDFVQQVQLHAAGGVVDEDSLQDLEYPITLEAIPSVRGDPGVRFLWPGPADWIARRID